MPVGSAGRRATFSPSSSSSSSALKCVNSASCWTSSPSSSASSSSSSSSCAMTSSSFMTSPSLTPQLTSTIEDPRMTSSAADFRSRGLSSASAYPSLCSLGTSPTREAVKPNHGWAVGHATCHFKVQKSYFCDRLSTDMTCPLILWKNAHF